MNIVEGDLIQLACEGRFDVIVHGCNCFCRMGAGIAKSIRKAFPKAYEADCATREGDRTKLGDISYAGARVGGNELIVINGYTQYHCGGEGVRVDYDAVRSVMRRVKLMCAEFRIGYPKIGAGLSGGDWDKISRIIDQELDGEDHTLVVYKPAVR